MDYAYEMGDEAFFLGSYEAELEITVSRDDLPQADVHGNCDELSLTCGPLRDRHHWRRRIDSG